MTAITLAGGEVVGMDTMRSTRATITHDTVVEASGGDLIPRSSPHSRASRA